MVRGRRKCAQEIIVVFLWQLCDIYAHWIAPIVPAQRLELGGSVVSVAAWECRPRVRDQSNLSIPRPVPSLQLWPFLTAQQKAGDKKARQQKELDPERKARARPPE